MNNLVWLFRFLIVALLFVFVYLFNMFFLSIWKSKRLEDFALDLNDYDDTVESFWLKIVFKISSFLESLVVFNSVGRLYDKYVYYGSGRLKKGMDYISIKLLLGLGFDLLYVVGTIIYGDTILALSLIVCFVIGFIIPDFYCTIKYKEDRYYLNEEMYDAVVIMNNSFKANKSFLQAICDVIDSTSGVLRREFENVLLDIKIGFDISEAFMRMGEKTGSKVACRIGNLLKLNTKANINVINIFDDFEKDLINEKMNKSSISNLKIVNSFIYGIVLLIPIFVFFITLFSNKSYMNLILGEYGFVVLIVQLVIYVYYVVTISLMLGECSSER